MQSKFFRACWENAHHNIAYLRRRYGLSRRSVAALLHIGTDTLAKIERGRDGARLKIDFLFMVHQVFDVPVEKLMNTRLEAPPPAVTPADN